MSGYTVFTCTKHTIYTCVFIYIYIEIYVCISDWCRHASCVKHKLKPIIRHIGQKNFKVDGLYHIDAPTKHHVTGRTPPASTALGQLQCSCMRVGQRGIMGHEKGVVGELKDSSVVKLYTLSMLGSCSHVLPVWLLFQDPLITPPNPLGHVDALTQYP